MKNKTYKKFFINSFLSSMPGFLSILLSFLSIPIYLKYGGKEEYGNYIFLHFLSFVAPVLNFGLGKISSISIVQNKNRDATALVLFYKTIKNSLIVLLFFFLFFIINKFFSFINSDVFILITLSIFFTILFVTIEGIFQGKELFFGLMLINLFFYGVSLSLPPFLLIFQYKNYENLFFISLIIKAVIIIISSYYLFGNKHLKFFYNYPDTVLCYSDQKWFSISNLLNIAYDIMDKYLIKLHIGSAALAIYSIPQQLTGKLSILSKGISAVLLPIIALGKKNKFITNDLLISLKIFIFVIPFLIFLFFNFFDIFFEIWLGKNSSNEIVNLAKIFSVVVWISCLSHLVISYYEGSGNIKKNSIIEIIFFPFFLIFLYISILERNLLIIAFIVLFKEIVLFLFRSIKIIKQFRIIKYSYLIILFMCCLLFNSLKI
jgi:O-antigen/teichoic acid export membrane protein